MRAGAGGVSAEGGARKQEKEKKEVQEKEKKEVKEDKEEEADDPFAVSSLSQQEPADSNGSCRCHARSVLIYYIIQCTKIPI